MANCIATAAPEPRGGIPCCAMRRALILLLLTFGLTAATASAQEPPPAPAPAPAPPPAEPRIRAAVAVAGIDVGGLTVAEAQAKLDQTLGPLFAADVIVAVAGKRFTFKPRKAKFVFRSDATAAQALAAGQAAPPAADGSVAPLAVAPVTRFRRVPVKTFVEKAAKKLYIPSRNAYVRITLRKILRRHSHEGRRLNKKGTRAAIEAALADPALPRLLKPGRLAIKAKVQVKDLGKVHPTIITIDRSSFRLRLFRNLRFSKGYGVAVGMPDYPTPAGLFAIRSKEVNPTWTAPNSPWAGELAGQSISGNDPTNPLKARWMGVSGAVGIHGTGQPWSIGSRASHGCIRMSVPDVIDLFRRVKIGTPVLIG